MRRLCFTSLFALVAFGIHAAELALGLPTVPERFLIERAAGPAEATFPMFGAFDNQGRLFVAESSGLDLYAELVAQTRKCRVRLLSDRDGDGRFESSQVFADKLVFPMGLAWRAGELFVSDPPDLVVLRDRDGDGRADERRVLLSGFGHRDNGSLHGLVFGPDGLLYMTMGDPDGFNLTGPDGSKAVGETGALIRCQPDGSRLEVVCWGFDNLVEIAFLPTGEVIGTDNWFQLPAGGIRDALVHLAPGGAYPRQSHKTSGQPLLGDVLPPVALYPAVALSGLARHSGVSVPHWMRGNLFSAQHNSRRVVRHALARAGSTFTSQDEPFVTSDDPDFHPSDVLEDADGSLLVIDTGGWYVQHCPTGRIRDSRAPGGIFRVRWREARPLADPWGRQIDWPNQTLPGLAGKLSDARSSVRERAREELVTRGSAAVVELERVISSSSDSTAKQEAVWALARIHGEAASKALRGQLESTDLELATLAARAVGLKADRSGAEALRRLLQTPKLEIQLAAAESLASCGSAEDLPALWARLAQTTDRFLRHALTRAIHRFSTRADLSTKLGDTRSQVAATALWLLDQPPHAPVAESAVAPHLTSPDAELAQVALRILQRHPEWADTAARVAADQLRSNSPGGQQAERLRELLLAFQDRPAVQAVVSSALIETGANTPSGPAMFLLETLARMTLREAPQTWTEGLRKLIRHPRPEVRQRAVEVAGLRRVAALNPELASVANDPAQIPSLRLEALRAVIERESNLTPALFWFVLQQFAGTNAPVARLAAGEVLSQARLDSAQRIELLRAAGQAPAMALPVVLAVVRKGGLGEEAASAFAAFLEKSLNNGWRPDEPEFAAALGLLPRRFEAETIRLRELFQANAEQNLPRLRAFEPLLNGGSEERGRTVFFSAKAACGVCHRVAEEGGLVGPDLTKIGAIRAGRDLIESIVLPSSTFAQGYEAFALTTKDGREAEGVIARRTVDTVVMRDASGAERAFHQEEIAELKRRDLSVMPEGLERALSEEEFRDLLAFLQSLK